MPKIAVVGLGRFGTALARELSAHRAEVLAIDRRSDLVDAIKDDVDLAVRLDSTDEAALVSQDLPKFDHCVVAIGENFETALLTTVIARKIGVPHITCRAQTAFHAEIFRRIGADDVIQPESQAGLHLARRLAHPHLEDYLALAEGYSLIEFHAPKAFQTKTLRTLDLRRRYNVNLVAIRRPVPEPDREPSAAEEADADRPPAEPTRLISVPRADDEILEGDILVMIGADEDLARLPKE